ncbi:MAG: ribosome recycling factor [Bacteroidota bacterium]|nr:ribosome recycling factor [Bacteroidota bacterium]
MNQDIQEAFDLAEIEMNETINYLKNKLAGLRAGKANVHMLDGIKVDYYGQITPLQQVSNVNTTDPHTITIQPWDKSMTEVIEKEIMKANLGFNPANKGDMLIINVPPLTEERRKELVKVVKQEEETGKISIREARKSTLDIIKKLKADGLSEDEERTAQDNVQDITNKFTKQVEELIKEKEKEIMTV